MDIIHQFKIKTRILILVIIPLLVTLFLAFQQFRSTSAQVDTIRKLEVLQQYMDVASPLISAMQQELLYNTMYIKKTKNPDYIEKVEPKFKQQLSQIRPTVDKAMSRYKNYVTDNEDLEQFPELVKKINVSLHKVRVLPYIRDNVDKKVPWVAPHPLEPQHPRLWTTGTLRNTIVSFIETANEVVILSSSNDELSLLAHSYKNILNAKQTAMLQVPAVFNGIYANLSVNGYGIIVKQLLLESLYLQDFQGLAPAHLDNYLDRELKQQEFYKKSVKLQDVIRGKSNKAVEVPIDIGANEWLETGKQTYQAYDRVINRVLQEIESTKNRLLSEANSAMYTTLGLIVVLLLLLGVVAVLMIRSINQPLKQLVEDFSKLSESKDMTFRGNLPGNNELSVVGKAFNSLVATFESTLLDVRAKVMSMDATTHSASESMNESIAFIEKLKESTDNISVAINEMTSTIHEVSRMSVSTSDTVHRAYDLSVDGEKDAQESKATMNVLFDELGKTSDIVTNLNEEANQIGNIVQVIKGISEQTNLLALNAAIEAARAGEAGRGFAVVADEVRSLSQRTNESTEQIEAQIEALTKGAKAASERMLTLQDNGNQAVEVVDKSTQAFSVIKTELDQITDMANQIAVAAEEQTQVADEINERIHAIKDDSEQLHAHGQKTLNYNKELLIKGGELNDNIDVFHF